MVRDCHLADGDAVLRKKTFVPRHLPRSSAYELRADPIRKNVLTLRWRRCAVVSELGSENADPRLAARQILLARLPDDVARSINEQFHREAPPREDFSPTNTRLKSAS